MILPIISSEAKGRRVFFLAYKTSSVSLIASPSGGNVAAR
jgi:hypothetical protein